MRYYTGCTNIPKLTCIQASCNPYSISNYVGQQTVQLIPGCSQTALLLVRRENLMSREDLSSAHTAGLQDCILASRFVSW